MKGNWKSKKGKDWSIECYSKRIKKEKVKERGKERERERDIRDCWV